VPESIEQILSVWRQCEVQVLDEVLRLIPGQAQDVLVLGRGQLERPSQRIKHLPGRLDVAGLLEPRVPGHADPRQQGDFLSAQSRRPPTAPRLETGAERLQTFPFGPQERCELISCIPDLIHSSSCVIAEPRWVIVVVPIPVPTLILLAVVIGLTVAPPLSRGPRRSRPPCRDSEASVLSPVDGLH
jgi:hypothetical protein